MADELRVDTVPVGGADGPRCARCEETAEITVFRERYRTVVRSRGFVRFLAAGVLLVLAAELLLTGRPTAAAVTLALGSLSAAWFGRAVLQSRAGAPVAVLHCHHCAARYTL